jgi:predicted DNA-binding protein (MmcQ/YjbR family)
MPVEWVRKLCLSFPSATETVQWGGSLVFKVGGKMFAVAATEPDTVWLSFKCDADDFAELPEREGVIPAPYLARAQWVGLTTEDAMPRAELKTRLRESYDLVVAKLPKKTRNGLVASAK